MNLVERIRQAGVVGAGGGGFPTHAKLAAKADTVIANGAECEPLLHKDGACMEHQAAAVVAGVRLAMEAVQAKTGVVAVKAKKTEAVEAIRVACQGTSVGVRLLGDYYPAGDEYDLVYEVTGRLIPPAGIPIQVGVVVANVETLANVAAAAEGVAVTRKWVTVAGAVKSPSTFLVPIGTPLREAIALSGGATTAVPVLQVGGLMMGQTSTDLDAPITKTTAGVIVLPRDHPLIRRRLETEAHRRTIGKSACDQCRFCTELCPRYLLGYPVEPHQVMRSLGFTATGTASWNTLAALCCACGLCTVFSCPEQLFPKEACDAAKAEMQKAGIKWTGPAQVKPHGLRTGRRVPVQMLMRRLGVVEYAHPAPLVRAEANPRQVVLPLKQAAGVANRPTVRPGDRVEASRPLGEIPEGALGALIHAPFAGLVTAVTGEAITLTRSS